MQYQDFNVNTLRKISAKNKNEKKHEYDLMIINVIEHCWLSATAGNHNVVITIPRYRKDTIKLIVDFLEHRGLTVTVDEKNSNIFGELLKISWEEKNE